MQESLVSIITPCYNSANFIIETMESVIHQTYQNWELLITDDGSKDNSVSIIQDYVKKDSRIRLFKIENSGAAVARNYSIKQARGMYIAFLDSDDIWLPFKLEKQIDFMELNNYNFTYSSYQKMDESGSLGNLVTIVKDRLNYKDMLSSNKIGCLTAVYNAEVLGKIYMPLIRKRQDYALWLKILKLTDFAYGLDEVLACYRIREVSISSSKVEMLQWNWKLFRAIEKKNFVMSLYYLMQNILNKFKSK